MTATGYGQTNDLSRVAKAGDTMSGTLTLNGNPAMVSSAGAQNGLVWTSDALGDGSWKPLGALLVANNLSDLSSAGAARTSLGLGGAAVLNVGTTSGTVAAGNSRLDQFQPPSSALAMNAQRITNVSNGTSATDAAALGQLPIVSGPPDNGLIAWNFDPVSATASTGLSNGQCRLLELRLPANKLISNLVIYVASGASGGVSNQNFAALLDASGNKIIQTADQTAAWASPGTKSMALTSSYTTSAAGSYYVTLLGNATVPMQLAAGSTSGQVANAGIAAAPWRFGNALSGQTSIPPSVNLATEGQEFPYWCGVS